MSNRVSRRSVLALGLAPGLIAARPPQASSTVIRQVTVVDVGSGELRPRQTIVIRGDRIASIGSSGSGTHAVDGKGLYVIPGLWDMHMHLWSEQPLFGLFLKNGVTGLRDMGSPPVRTRRWRKLVSSGALLGPRIITAGTPIDGPGPRMPEMPVLTASNPNEARRAGDEWEKEGVDFIKVLGNLSRDSYTALAAAARQMRWSLAGHLPPQVSASEAVFARQESIEHLFGMFLSCSSEESPLRRETPTLKTAQKALDTYSVAKARELFDTMRRYETYLTPTLTMHRREAQLDGDDSPRDPQLALVPESVKNHWKTPAEKPEPESAEFQKRQFPRFQQLVKDLQANGVRLLAGTDTGDPFVVPGASLHDELAEMVTAGLTPLQALQTATRNPAAFLHLDDRLGSVERGRYADLVLLEANPLADIRNTRRVAGVVIAGRYLSRRELDALAHG